MRLVANGFLVTKRQTFITIRTVCGTLCLDLVHQGTAGTKIQSARHVNQAANVLSQMAAQRAHGTLNQQEISASMISWAFMITALFADMVKTNLFRALIGVKEFTFGMVGVTTPGVRLAWRQLLLSLLASMQTHHMICLHQHANSDWL